MKIVFFGNSDFSVEPLQKLIDNFDVVGVVTAPDSTVGRGHKKQRLNPVKELALHYNIPILQPEKIRKNELFFGELSELRGDIHVIVSYGKILPKDMIFIPKWNTINLHASILPKLRGAAPIQYALWKGLTETGNTIQFITEGMDEGDILAQSIVKIFPEDDYLSLEKKLSTDGAELLVRTIQNIESITPIPQNHDEATYTSLISKDDGAVYFSMSAEDIINAFRAFKVRPSIYLPLEIGMVKIVDCSLGAIDSEAAQGEILSVSKDGVEIACYEGTVILKTLQAPNKKPLPAQDLINGWRLKKGMIIK